MPDMILLETEERMENHVDHLSKEFVKVRTGRANPKVFADVFVDYYGASTPISQVGSISIPEPTQLVVKPYDKSIVKDVEKAILAANLGFTPNNEGHQLRIVLPALTTERRRELIKDIKKYGEECKVQIRAERHKGNDLLKKLEKNKDISEDELKLYLDEVQELTNKFIDRIDQLVKEKDEDIMSI